MKTFPFNRFKLTHHPQGGAGVRTHWDHLGSNTKLGGSDLCSSSFFFIVLSRSWLGWFDDTIVTTEIQLKSILGKNMKVLSITALKSNLSTPLYHHTSCYYVILSFVKIKGSSLSLPIWFRKLSAESSHLPKCWIIPKEISWVPKNLTRKCWQETCHIAAMAGLRLWDRYSIYCQLIGGFHKCTTHGVWGTQHNAFTLK